MNLFGKIRRNDIFDVFIIIIVDISKIFTTVMSLLRRRIVSYSDISDLIFKRRFVKGNIQSIIHIVCVQPENSGNPPTFPSTHKSAVCSDTRFQTVPAFLRN